MRSSPLKNATRYGCIDWDSDSDSDSDNSKEPVHPLGFTESLNYIYKQRSRSKYIFENFDNSDSSDSSVDSRNVTTTDDDEDDDENQQQQQQKQDHWNNSNYTNNNYNNNYSINDKSTPLRPLLISPIPNHKRLSQHSMGTPHPISLIRRFNTQAQTTPPSAVNNLLDTFQALNIDQTLSTQQQQKQQQLKQVAIADIQQISKIASTYFLDQQQTTKLIQQERDKSDKFNQQSKQSLRKIIEENAEQAQNIRQLEKQRDDKLEQIQKDKHQQVQLKQQLQQQKDEQLKTELKQLEAQKAQDEALKHEKQQALKEKQQSLQAAEEEKAAKKKQQELKEKEHINRAQKLIHQLQQIRISVASFDTSTIPPIPKRRLNLKKLVKGRLNTLNHQAQKVRDVAQDLVLAIQQARAEDEQFKQHAAQHPNSIPSEASRGKRYLLDLITSNVVARVQTEQFNG